MAALLLSSCAPRELAAAASDSQPDALQAVTYRPVELQFTSRVTLDASFVSPSGQTLQSRTFARKGWQVLRFTPTEPGRWRYRVMAKQRLVIEGVIAATKGTGGGFVRARGRRLVLDNGAPFIALGENRINIYDPSWNWNSLGIEAYVRHMADHGMTTLRVFVVSDVENEEKGGANPGVLEPALGRFDEQVAAQFDRIFRAAEAHGVYVVLVAFALGFSEEDAWKSWYDNPYAQARGGPVQTRYEFFESAEARAKAGERLRYLAARYAASPSLLAIDLLNEPEWDGEIPETSWTVWAQEMTRIWDEADPYDHLVTVGSVGLHWNIEGDERAWWDSEACDIVQWHLYGKDVYDVHALAAEMKRKVSETWTHGKPVLVGEFAYGREPKPEYDHTHVGIWSATFSGAGVLAHSAPPFNVDSDEPMTPERARHFRVLRDFLAGLPALSRAEAGATDGVAWALVAEHAAAVWLLGPKEAYGQKVEGVRVTLPKLSAGRWRVRWIDDVSGRTLAQSQFRSSAEAVQLPVPVFTRHIAARLKRD